MPDADEVAGSAPLDLANFIHTQRERILSVWERRVRSMERADQLSSRQLRDHLPQVLEHISHELQRRYGGGSDPAPESPELHALHRLEEGFDQRHLVTEYSLLRDVVLELYAAVTRGVIRIDELVRLNQVIDEAIVVSLNRHNEQRQRALIALDRISQAALVSDDVEVFMPPLLRALMESNPAIDALTVMLLEEGDVLRVHAAVGLEELAQNRLTIPVGEGFAGRIAQSRQPMELYGADIAKTVMSQYLRDKGVKVLYGVPLLEGDHLLGVVHMGSLSTWEFSDEDKILFRTMSERVAALLHRHKLRELALAEQVRAMEFRDRFLGIVSHDLRNPLNAISLSANRLLMEEGLSESTLKATRRMVNAANRMSRMIADLLDFTRGRLGGGIPVNRQPVNLRHTARHVIDELGIAYPSRELRLQADGDFTGQWDPDRLAQLLGNLLKNALDYSPEGTPVIVALSGDDATVKLDVQNAGTPIPKELLPTVFDPFRRAAGEGQGLGLGLYIVKEIARAHGGTVEVRSDAATGTTFSVQLPRSA